MTVSRDCLGFLHHKTDEAAMEMLGKQMGARSFIFQQPPAYFSLAQLKRKWESFNWDRITRVRERRDLSHTSRTRMRKGDRKYVKVCVCVCLMCAHKDIQVPTNVLSIHFYTPATLTTTTTPLLLLVGLRIFSSHACLAH